MYTYNDPTRDGGGSALGVRRAAVVEARGALEDSDPLCLLLALLDHPIQNEDFAQLLRQLPLGCHGVVGHVVVGGEPTAELEDLAAERLLFLPVLLVRVAAVEGLDDVGAHLCGLERGGEAGLDGDGFVDLPEGRLLDDAGPDFQVLSGEDAYPMDGRWCELGLVHDDPRLAVQWIEVCGELVLGGSGGGGSLSVVLSVVLSCLLCVTLRAWCHG